MASDGRFDNYVPTPVDQGVLSRGIRSTTGALSESMRTASRSSLKWGIGAFLAVSTLLIAGPIVIPAALSALGASGLTLGALSFGQWASLGVAAIAGLGTAIFAAPVGGLKGLFRGYTQERQRSAADQMAYDLTVAHAVAQGRGLGVAYQAAPDIAPQAAKQDIRVAQDVAQQAEAFQRTNTNVPKTQLDTAAVNRELQGTVHTAQLDRGAARA